MAWVFEAGSRRLEFTGETSGLGLVDTPEISFDAESEVFANPRGDGRRVGRDFVAGQVVSLLVEARPDLRPLDDVWRDLVGAWRADEVRLRGGVLASLTADSGRCTYGRPRPMRPDLSKRLYGMVSAELVFESVDDLWYGPASSTTIRLVPPVSGGLTFPAEAPFTFDSGPTVRNGSVLVEGDLPVWPVFEISGPVSDPVIDVPGVGRLVFRVALTYDEVLRVDTRPWARWVKRGFAGVESSFVALPGALSSSGSRLSDMALSPGAHTVVLRGYDASGTAELRVSTEPAYTSF